MCAYSEDNRLSMACNNAPDSMRFFAQREARNMAKSYGAIQVDVEKRDSRAVSEPIGSIDTVEV